MSATYDELTHRSRRLHPGFSLLRELPDLQFSARPRRGKSRSVMQYHPGAIYALSSGMMSENTVSNEFAFHFLANPANSLCFVGYADPDSPAGRIKNTPQGYPVRLNENREPVLLNCPVETFDFSGHSDREGLRAYARDLKPRRWLGGRVRETSGRNKSAEQSETHPIRKRRSRCRLHGNPLLGPD